MKQIELTVLSRDVDAVIRYLGSRGIMHFSEEGPPSFAASPGGSPHPPVRAYTNAGGADSVPSPGSAGNEIFRANTVSAVPDSSVSSRFIDSRTHALDEAALKHIRENLERLKTTAQYLGIQLPTEPDESSEFPSDTEESLTDTITTRIAELSLQENEDKAEKQRVEEALNEAKAFTNLNAPFADLDQLSYLTLRVGRLDARGQQAIRESLVNRAVIIPLGEGSGAGDNQGVLPARPAGGSRTLGLSGTHIQERAAGFPGAYTGNRVLAVASRKGRFALDSELGKWNFQPIAIPEGYKGVPAELLAGLESRLQETEARLHEAAREKTLFKDEYAGPLKTLASSYLMAGIVEELKGKLRATKSSYFLTGWVPADSLQTMVEELKELTGGRTAVRAFNPEELPEVKDGKKKVPVSLSHGAFVKGFEGVVFSYGSPLYGTIDPTPFVAVFFTILFGIMFGDVGQGLVLLLLGILTGKHGPKFLASSRKYSVPLVAVGCSSMVMGFLNGEIFTNEEILIGPTRFITDILTGHPVDRILTIMPLAEKGGSVTKLFYFFGFTISVGIILNTIGLLVNIVNLWSLKKYENALFSKTGLSGLLLFWYALSIAVRSLLGGGFAWFDMAGLILPVLAIFFGPLVWRLVSGTRPVLEHGLMVFIMEGFVEILETASTYISNTVSFLRVGAFALSHAVLSYIVFRFSEEIAVGAGPVGGGAALLIMIFGNAVIIVLEGMIVAIQVVRLQYYEFFSKFFTETGVEFSPFRFRKNVEETAAGSARQEN
jgi:V/A-type H+-transporting ATPase subunit I